MANHNILLMTVLLFWETMAWCDTVTTKAPEASAVQQVVSKSITDKESNPNTSTLIIKNLPVHDKNTPVTITINPPSGVTPVPVSQPLPSMGNEQAKQPIKSSDKIEIPPVPSLDIVVNKKYKNSPKLKRLYQLLGLRHSPNVIHLVTNRNIANKKDAIIAIRPRSFLTALDYLSNAVQVAPDMIKKNLVVVPQYPNGKYYDLTDITKGVFLIHISPTRPTTEVSVEVFYRDHWFYIADTDYKSKRTFAMLQQIFNLQAGETPGQNIPILTIPTR